MSTLRTIVGSAIVLAFIVVTLGAYTRLTDAGLGCPDWPGCYGHLLVPSIKGAVTTIEPQKAWTEMIHRYAAGTLGLLIVIFLLGVLNNNRKGKRTPWVVSVFLMLLVLFQAALGMWTVTLKLLPVVVMGHLLGGLLIFSSLCYVWWQLGEEYQPIEQRFLSSKKQLLWINVGIVVVFCQIALGGWVSSNYAGIACVGFPTCNGQWFPIHHVREAFNLFSSIGANYQGGILDSSLRVTIQVIHRAGAYITVSYVLMLSCVMMLTTHVRAIRITAMIAMLLVLLQFGVGVVNVIYFLPLWNAVLHNGLAALLLATMVSLRYLAQRGKAHAN